VPAAGKAGTRMFFAVVMVGGVAWGSLCRLRALAIPLSGEYARPVAFDADGVTGQRLVLDVSQVSVQPLDHVLRDFLAVDLVEDFVPRTGKHSKCHVGDASIAVSLRQKLHELSTTR
jgi:hypothetical protein